MEEQKPEEKTPEAVKRLEEILGDSFRREVLLQGFGTGNPIRLGQFHRKFYDESVADTFAQNKKWRAYLLEHAKCLTEKEAEALFITAYDVYASIEFVLMERPGSDSLKELSEINPGSRFKEDLVFDAVDYGILQGTLKYSPDIENFEMPRAEKKLSVVTDCVELVLPCYTKKIINIPKD